MRVPVLGTTMSRARWVCNLLAAPTEHIALLSSPCWEIQKGFFSVYQFLVFFASAGLKQGNF